MTSHVHNILLSLLLTRLFRCDQHEELVLTVEDITNTGLGVGRIRLNNGTNWVVMVPLVLPDETVQIRIHRNHKNYSEADLIKVLNASKDRIEPECKYFSECGGCQYQHMSISAQREWKRKQVRSLLGKVGGIDGVKVNPTVGTQEYLYSYRAKLTPHYNAPKTVDDLKIGFQRRGTRVMVDVDECIIGTKSINEVYSTTRKDVAESVKKKLPKKGATLLFRECDEGVITDPRQTVTHTLKGIKFSFKAGEFFQNNHYVLPMLVDHVLKMAQGDGCNLLVDAYCGSGLFALSASKLFDFVYGIEVSEIATSAATETAGLNNICNVDFTCGVSERIFSKVSKLCTAENTVMIIDPPRKGCDQSFLDQFAAFGPKKLVYVSCDPATQSRDAKFIIQNGYSIVDVTPFDLFPQTRHIENVITFIRDRA